MQKRGQIWIETVIYTLIGITIIGILLTLINPVIEKKKDQVIIEQSLSMINTIEGEIADVRFYGVGNSRPIEVKIQKGKLIINSKEDFLEFSMESEYMYSEPGQIVEIGKVKALTTEQAGTYMVSLKLDYANKLNLTWNKQETEKTFQFSPTPYKIVVTNVGKTGEFTNIDFS